MKPVVIVERHVFLKAAVELSDLLVLVQVEPLVFEGPPETFHEDVVQGPASAVHADSDLSLFERSQEGLAGELTALVGVEDLRRPLLKSPVQGDDTELGVEGVGELPRENEPAVPIDHGCKVHEATAHREVGDIGAPDLIRPDDGGVPKQVGIDLVFGARSAGPRLGADAFKPHESHQPSYPLAVYAMVLAAQPGRHPPAPVKGRPGVLAVD